MITSKDCFAKYGDPSANDRKFMVIWDVPTALEHGAIPKRIYCNKDLIPLLEKAFKNLIDTGHISELKVWSGCFNIRNKRGARSLSLHSWGIAIDMNPLDNQFKKTRAQMIAAGKTPFTDGFVKCFKDAGFDWGGDWRTPDLMHFQLAKI